MNDETKLAIYAARLIEMSDVALAGEILAHANQPGERTSWERNVLLREAADRLTPRAG